MNINIFFLGFITVCSFLDIAGSLSPSQKLLICDNISKNLDFNVLKLLLNNNILDINNKDTNGRTLLHLTQDPDQVDFLLGHGANPNLADYVGKTPIYYTQNVNIIDKLHRKGARINHSDQSGYTPLHLSKNVDVTEYLLKHGAYVNCCCVVMGMTPLQLTQDYYIAEALLNAGANPDNRNNYDLQTMLHRTRDPKIVELLLSKKSNPHLQDHKFRNSLHTSLLVENFGENDFEKISQLLEAGVDPNVKDYRGNTPLHYTDNLKDRDNLKVTELLLGYGPNLSIKNDQGQTILDVTKNPEKAKLLLAYGAGLYR